MCILDISVSCSSKIPYFPDDYNHLSIQCCSIKHLSPGLVIQNLCGGAKLFQHFFNFEDNSTFCESLNYVLRWYEIQGIQILSVGNPIQHQ